VSKWTGKYVIGLTGNIATGKSVVRKMLEHLGAYGIDADALSHRAMSKGAPGYQPIIDQFGKWIIGSDGQIDRARLGRVVFSDPAALAILESIIHPLVSQAIDMIVNRTTQTVIVIEAIKLVESGINKNCDSLWVSVAPPNVQLARLIQNRKMTEADARTRIMSQPPQEQKAQQANVVIKNMGSFEDTWKQVSAHWQRTITPIIEPPAPVRPTPQQAAPINIPLVKVIPTPAPTAPLELKLTTERGRPGNSADIAALITRLANDGKVRTKDDIMAAFGEKAFLLLKNNQTSVGVVAWQVENLVARATDIYIESTIPAEQALSVIITEMEKASRELQCEASLLFLNREMAQHEAIWKKLGYDKRQTGSLGVQAWEEAAKESLLPGNVLLFKQLRVDRILRPI